MRRPILSICIPTYNRAFLLEGLLENLKAQLSAPQTSARVEIVVVDGASGDRTPEVVRRAVSNGMAIEYVRRESRMGIDADVLKCVETARAEFCWFLSDDDRVYAGSVGLLTDVLAQNRGLAGCFVNRHSYGKAMTYRVVESKLWPHELLKRDHLFTDKAECFSVLGIDLGFLSSQVVNTNVWREAIKGRDLTGYCNCYLLVYVIGLMMDRSCRWLYVDAPLVLQRTGNDSFLAREGYLRRQHIEQDGLAQVISAHYPPGSPVYRAVFRKMVARLPRVVANMKSCGVSWRLQAAILGMYGRRYRGYRAFWTTVVPVFLLPNRFLALAKRFYYWHAGRRAVVAKG